MAKIGQKPRVLTCKSGTFMCYAYGQKVWKFHGERSCDRMPGEENFSRPVIMADTFMRKRHGEATNMENRKLGRSSSTGSSSSSESECSSQPSPLSETSEDPTHGFLSPASVREDSSESDGTMEQDSPPSKQQCPPPSPIEVKTKVDIKTLSNLINSLLKKHSLVQTGLELLKQKPALALKLQSRRPRKVLVDQGIIPPLKSPGVFYEQRQKLERARTGDFLNKKMQDRPERDYLVQKHILEDTSAYDSIVANQKELKKAKLVDDLNEKIFNRPGVFELVEKNILPADDNVTEAIKDGNIRYKTTTDFDEDSSDAFSPEQPASNEHVASYGSPPPSSVPTALPTSIMQPLPSWNHEKKPEGIISMSTSSKMPRSVSSTHTTAGHHPYLIRQTSSTKSSKISPSSLSQRNLRKKNKDKPKFKKFKYHQYIPPDQQGKASEQSIPSMDTPYSRLLEQQQLYLQLQIMNQQYPALIANQKPSSAMDGSKSLSTPPPPPAPPMVASVKTEKKLRTFTVQQLEEMKVAELKEELKARKEKVTGTKEVLIERLKRFAMPGPKPQSSNQPISESITGLINATIQSTIRANTEQALAAAVNSNGAAGALLLKSSVLSPKQKQESQRDSKSVGPMDAQHEQPQTFRYAQTSDGSIQLQQSSGGSNTFMDTNDSGPSGSAPGQRHISPAPGMQFPMDSTTNQNHFNERLKDDLLHKQQQEIEDLKRMVELHRTQLYRIQEKERTNMPEQPVAKSNSNPNSLSSMNDQHLDMVTSDQSGKKQHVSQVLQKHLQNRINTKDIPLFLNGSNQPVIKEEYPENVFSYPGGPAPPNVSLISSNSGDNPGTSSHQEDNPIVLNIKPPLERTASESKDPPKYDQAIQQMLNDEKRRLSHHSFGSQDNMTGSPANLNDFNDVDDLLELLENKGEIPVTPTRQKAFPQVALIEGRVQQHATMHYHYGQQQPQQQHMRTGVMNHRRSMDHLQRTISCNERDNMIHHPQRHSLEISSTMVPLNDLSAGFHIKDQNFQRRHSGDLLTSGGNRRHSGDILGYQGYQTGVQQHHHHQQQQHENQTDFTSLLVSSAGDILMDSNHMPPSNLHGRAALPNCLSPEAVALHQEPILSASSGAGEDNKNNSFLGFNDPYANQPFSPMDTGTNDGHSHNGMMEERTGDPHLSSSSIHDSAQSLDKCLDSVSMPRNTKSFLRRYEQPLAGASPLHHQTHLVKSSSQELLTDHMQSMDHSMQIDDELGWLDLNLTSASPAPSPMNLQQQNRQSMHSSLGSVLEQDNPYNFSVEGFGSTPNEFDLILVDSLNMNPIGNAWDGL